MKMLVPASLLLLVVAGCNNQHTQQLNPFNAYGAQRLPPPPTQSYGQAATTQPYYPGPAAGQAPALNGGYQNGAYQSQPPAQLAPPPANSTPMNGSSYQGWKGANSTNSSSASSGVAQASYTEEVSSSTSSTPSAPVTASAGNTTSNVTPTITGDTSSTSSNPYMNGMRVNEVSQTAQPLAPATTATLPSDGWGAPAPLPSASAPIQAIPKPSRIP